MVLLKFKIVVHGSFQQVFDYVGNFQNVQYWDPGCVSSKLKSDFNMKKGALYDLVTVFNEKQSNMLYELTDITENSVKLVGEGDIVKAVDQISFQKGQSENTTEISYEADIKLKGIYQICTPFIKKKLEKLGLDAQNGLQKNLEEKFSKK